MWQQTHYFPLLFTIAYFLVSADNIAVNTEQLKLCGEESTSTRSLVFVSTLDGKISALDVANHGQKLWTLDFNDGPMLSSNIHRRELNNNGQWIRLIPSLNGALYKFDGENLENVPISTDQLLRSSYRYSDDLVFSGGKELHSYGVSASTGQILYECNVDGCKNNTNREGYLEQEQDLLIIQRLQQTVRAIEALTGIERWNFSVGQHDLVLSPSADIYCSNKATALNIEIKAIIPEGLIWAVSKNDPVVKLWQHKFDSPIVTIWRENASKTSTNKGSLEQINLFDSSQWTWGSEHSTVNPSLYLGMHEKQLYVQENFNLQNSDLDLFSTRVQHTRYPWQPYPADETALTSTSLSEDNNEVSDEATQIQSTTALSVLYNSEYINGNGFYLYSKNQLTDQCNRSNMNMLNINEEKPISIYTTEETDEESDQIQVIIWIKWKGMLMITLAAILLNYLYMPHFILRDLNNYYNNVMTIFKTKNTVLLPSIIEGQIEKSDLINGDSENINNFKSRYLTDFEPVDCLGKGGYGVVFEAKNKIDDCNYAIKRIALPNSGDSRERVMREVKALAKLDHHNIVRYFNAWLECPPCGWQEEHDQQWIDKLKSSSGFPSEITQTETRLNGSVCIDVSHTDPSSIENALDALKFNNKNVNDDSFVVFEKSSKQYDTDAIYIDGCSTDNSNLVSSRNETEEELSDVKDTSHSDSIVFEATDNSVLEKEKYEHQKLFSSDLNNKSNKQKSAKMFLYIQMQLCQRLSLREWLKQHTSARDPFQVLNIFQQIIGAVEYVHLQGLIHRDLKPSNIFFAYDNKIKIGDFGLVTAMTESCDEICISDPENENITFKNSIHTACVGTHLYMSPEQISGQMYNYKVDIYSLGIIFFELLTPFFTDMERIVALSNLKQLIFPKNFADIYTTEYNLLKMMLDNDPTKRPTTLGIKSRLPLQNYEIANELNTDKDSKWHFELPQLTRHSSVTSSNTSNESFEHIS
ncbi:eukaryotic translation initiation factor 2-alpha kinase-like [Linepithema humile]|uniref:eukaryotic translation initiation factor 2-alpha kinase-like n=1 Tax=Linepithema humile TaxID=83485 RepID=UPI00351E3D07